MDVLRQASRACVKRREFVKAGILVKQAVGVAKAVFGDSHLKLADSLSSYGYYLLNMDFIDASLVAYQKHLKVRRTCFGGFYLESNIPSFNLHVALAHEDLAYATYVAEYRYSLIMMMMMIMMTEYSTGRFTVAREHVEEALRIMRRHLPCNHVSIGSSLRVLALINEEITIDRRPRRIKDDPMILRAEEIHFFALNLSCSIFGDNSIEMAKHYGNLGRLYQTMGRYTGCPNFLKNDPTFYSS